MRTALTLGIAAICVFGGGGVAHANPAYIVSDSTIEIGDWTLIPVYTPVSGSDVEVTDMLAVKNPSVLSGNNLAAIWYSSDTAGWATKSWYSSNPWVAVETIKQQLGIADDQDIVWAMTLGEQPTTQQLEPEPLSSTGVLESDPALQILESSTDPELLVDILISVGYPAASVPIPLGEACEVEAVGYVAGIARSMIENGDSETISFSNNTDLCLSARAPEGDPPAQTPIPTNVPSWSPRGTMPTAPAWAPGGWPVDSNGDDRWLCVNRTTPSGVPTCRCSRVQLWGRWEQRSCWFGLFTCTKWRRIRQVETCSETNAQCPTSGPPQGPIAGCNSTTRFY